MIKIGQASRDERGRYSGGMAGNQDGREVLIREWYNRPWNKVLRARNSNIAEKIATAMEKACKNNNIGYDQNQRMTLYSLAKANGWRIEDIKTPCETDCSALVSVCVNAAGIRVSGDIYTGNEASALLRTGEFELLTAPKYLLSYEYLRRGDILLYEFHHTAIALQDGRKAEKSRTAQVEYPLGWNVDKDGQWWYADTPHSRIAGRWAYIDGRWYVFDQKGYMIKGWFKQGDDWYYMNPDDGAMLSGQWVDVECKSYYLTQSGLMARNGYIEDASEKLYFFVDDEGRYVKELDTDAPDLSKYEVIE
nr:cell surface protein [uncultured Lachnoanaerobaculum sp.]